jgi:hypothetical protein
MVVACFRNNANTGFDQYLQKKAHERRFEMSPDSMRSFKHLNFQKHFNATAMIRVPVIAFKSLRRDDCQTFSRTLNFGKTHSKTRRKSPTTADRMAIDRERKVAFEHP